MSECWICKQKAEYRREKLTNARLMAMQKAKDEEKTMAIWKQGYEYKFGIPSEAGSNTIIEYVSKHTQITTA